MKNTDESSAVILLLPRLQAANLLSLYSLSKTMLSALGETSAHGTGGFGKRSQSEISKIVQILPSDPLGVTQPKSSLPPDLRGLPLRRMGGRLHQQLSPYGKEKPGLQETEGASQRSLCTSGWKFLPSPSTFLRPVSALRVCAPLSSGFLLDFAKKRPIEEVRRGERWRYFFPWVPFP